MNESELNVGIVERDKRIAELEASQVWRPMETARDWLKVNPDAKKILATDGDSIFITRWVDDVYAEQGGSGGPCGWFSGKYRDNWGDDPEFDNPTHWMPLPPPPALKSGDA